MSMDKLHDIPRKVSIITLRVSISRNRCSSVYFYMAKILQILSKLPKKQCIKKTSKISVVKDPLLLSCSNTTRPHTCNYFTY